MMSGSMKMFISMWSINWIRKFGERHQRGKTLNFLYFESYNGNYPNFGPKPPKIYSAPIKLISTHNTSWYPFFLMGQRPGGHYWQALVRK
ncbi:MAG: hypothetical protein Ct9H300mP4_17340 [Gammaproteobacteria bacterium]|nr:MAG: hypothetical protein Ct9H300mP4_17340 [Gammaproteobacteria bacterium]